MLGSKRPFKSNIFLIGLVVLIGASYAFYFLSYVPNHERQITKTAYNRLEQVHSNIIDKTKNLNIRFEDGIKLARAGILVEQLQRDSARLQELRSSLSKLKRDDSIRLQELRSSLSELESDSNRLQELQSSSSEPVSKSVLDEIESKRKVLEDSLSEITIRGDNAGFPVLRKSIDTLKYEISQNILEIKKLTSSKINSDKIPIDYCIVENKKVRPNEVISLNDLSKEEGINDCYNTKYPYYMGFFIDKEDEFRGSIYYPFESLMNDISEVPFFDNIGVLNKEKVNDSKQSEINSAVSGIVLPLTSPEKSSKKENLHTIYSRSMSLHQLDENVLRSTSYDSLFATQSYTEANIDGQSYRIFSRPIELMNTRLVLIGLKKVDDIQDQSRSINQYVAVILVLVLFILIISFPFIKLFLIDKHEKIGISDLYVLGLSTIMGYAVVIITFLILNNHYSETARFSREESKIVAENIAERFNNRLDTLLSALDRFEIGLDSVISIDQTVDASGIPKRATFLAIKAVKNKGNDIFRYIPSGKDQFKRIVVPSFPVSERKYFTDIIERNFKYQKSNRKFVIEIVYSWRNNRPQVVISKLVPKIKYEDTESEFVLAVMTEDFFPFFDPVLPEDFTFCLVNKQGDVKLHSDVTKNNRENIYKEITNTHQLQALISTDKSDSLPINYKGFDHEAYTLPIEGLDWNLVVMKRATSDTLFEVVTAYYNTLALIIWFSLVIFITLVVKFSQKKDSILQKKKFAYSWLLPNQKDTPFARKTYINICLIGAEFVIFHLTDSLLQAIFIHLIIILVSSVTNYALLNIPLIRRNQTNKVIWYKSSTVLKHIIPHFLAFLLILWWIYKFRESFENELIIFLIIGVFLALGLVTNTNKKIFAKIKESNFYKSINRKTWYILFLYSWLILITVIPTKAYFEIINEAGKKTWTKTSLHDYARTVNFRFEDYKSEQANPSSSSLAGYLAKNSLSQGLISSSQQIIHSCDSNHLEYKLWKMVWPSSNFVFGQDYIPPYQEFIGNGHNPNQCAWIVDNEAIYATSFPRIDSITTLVYKREVPQKALVLYSKLLPSSFAEFVFWILSLVCTFQIIRLIATKGLNINLNGLFSTYKNHSLDRIFHIPCEQLSKSNGDQITEMKTKVPNRVFITSPNGSGITGEVLDVFEKLGFNYDVIDLHDFNLEAVKKSFSYSRKEIILVTGLDYNLYEIDKSNDTIELLEFLHGLDKLRCFVRSTVELDFVYSFFSKQQEVLALDSQQLIQFEQLHDRYESIFRNYVQVHFSMDWRSRHLPIPYEFRGSYYMSKLRTYITDEVSKPENRERAILQIQQYANSYFHEIWNSCTDAEKLIIYDLAEDDLINASDSISLKNLYQKGILYIEEPVEDHLVPRLELFSEAFGNFVLESDKFIEAKKIEKDYRRKGKWQSTSIILLTIIAALIVFFIFAKPHILERVNSAVALAIAIVPALIRFSQGLFNFSLTKS